jgi:SMI1 / KNR4 family (SUKH-1)
MIERWPAGSESGAPRAVLQTACTLIRYRRVRCADQMLRTHTMRQDTISRLDAKFAEFPIMRASDQPSEAEIARIEQQIGVPFVEDYRQILLRYGGAMVGAYPVFGLRPVEVMGAKHWSVVEVTMFHRSQRVPYIDQWVVFSEDHAGNPIGMDRDGLVWIHDHDFGGLAPLAHDFEECIRERFLKLGA